MYFDIDCGILSDLCTESNETSEEQQSHTMSERVAKNLQNAGFNNVDILHEEHIENTEALYNQLIYDHIHKMKKRIRYKQDGLPRIMRNDIRWYYPQMFMNTVNSGDFHKMKGYFHTFMTKPCKFIVDHEINPSFGIPHRLLVNGSKLMAYYLLGVLAIFPDFILTMTNSQIITAREWTGSKITINVELKSTKLFDIALESWVPQVKYLAQYKQSTTHNHSVRDTNTVATAGNSTPATAVACTSGSKATSNAATTFTTTTTTSLFENTKVSDRIASNMSPSPVLSAYIADISGDSGNAYISPEDTEIRRKGYRYMPSHSKTTTSITSISTDTKDSSNSRNSNITCSTSSTSSNSTTDDVIVGKKRKNDATSHIYPHISSNTTNISPNSSSTTTPVGVGENINPDMLIKALFTSATLQKTPQFLHALGTITLFLDVNNNMQHINLILAQAPNL